MLVRDALGQAVEHDPQALAFPLVPRDDVRETSFLTLVSAHFPGGNAVSKVLRSRQLQEWHSEGSRRAHRSSTRTHGAADLLPWPGAGLQCDTFVSPGSDALILDGRPCSEDAP
jgi:hypothetical protein